MDLEHREDGLEGKFELLAMPCPLVEYQADGNPESLIAGSFDEDPGIEAIVP